MDGPEPPYALNPNNLGMMVEMSGKYVINISTMSIVAKKGTMPFMIFSLSPV
jgi:hypothetical protein